MLRDTLLRQLSIGWALANYHLDGLTTEECLWHPSERGPHVSLTADGRWRADWPPGECYEDGPPSIGWISWHMLMWWTLALDRNFGTGSTWPEDVAWPGEAAALRAQLGTLHQAWSDQLESIDDGRLRATGHVKWPFEDRTLADLFAWANVELTKNAAEIGYARFLFASR